MGLILLNENEVLNLDNVTNIHLNYQGGGKGGSTVRVFFGGGGAGDTGQGSRWTDYTGPEAETLRSYCRNSCTRAYQERTMTGSGSGR